MPNNFFQFKEFTIQQEKSTMKVCTDSCLFGAWVADKLEKKVIQAREILDIGSGTGLLSLMLAQKSNATIEAVELDKNSFDQTEENFAQSKWNSRLSAFQADINHWETPKKFELIICNPPFFENDLRSLNTVKNMSKHDESLTLEQLLNNVSDLLSEHGCFAVLLPFHRYDYFKKLAYGKKLHMADEAFVKQTPLHSYFRAMAMFTTNIQPFSSTEMTIKNKEGKYSEPFNTLLSDYYL